MTPKRANEMGREAARIGAADRIPDELILELSDEGIFEYHEGHAQGLAKKREQATEGVAA